MKIKVIVACVVALILVTSGLFIINNYSKAQKVKINISQGNKYIEEKNYHEAITAFEKVVKIKPKNVEARIGLSKAYIELNKTAEAEKVLMDALEITKKEPRIYIELARLYLKLDKGKDAIDILTTGYNEANNEQVKKLLDEITVQPEAPDVNIKGGNYDFPQEVSISASGDVNIYYTRDNTAPSTSSNKYSSPIIIDSGKTILRVIAISKTGISSNESIFEYNIKVKLFNENDLKLSKIKIGMTKAKVIELLGNPKKISSEIDDYPCIEFTLLDYNFGTLWFDKKTSGLYRFKITTNDITVGYRNIKIGDSVESVINKYPNNGKIKYPETVLYDIHQSDGILNIGRVNYDANNKICSVIYIIGLEYSDCGISIEYGIVNGRVSYICYW